MPLSNWVLRVISTSPARLRTLALVALASPATSNMDLDWLKLDQILAAPQFENLVNVDIALTMVAPIPETVSPPQPELYFVRQFWPHTPRDQAALRCNSKERDMLASMPRIGDRVTLKVEEIDFSLYHRVQADGGPWLRPE